MSNSDGSIPIRRALVSVYDKTGLDELATALHAAGVQIVSTGSTAVRIAAAGEHGVHVPEMLGRYRTQPASMVSLTNLAAGDLRAHLVARYPALPWPDA